MAQTNIKSVRPLDAATVILLRSENNGFSVYLMRRSSKSDSFSSLYVFPGGLVEQGDRAQSPIARQWRGHLSDYIQESDISEGLATSLVQAAVRETFEEAGVLVAVPAEKAALAARAGTGLRRQVAGRELALEELFKEHGLAIDPRDLVPFARWITPVDQPRRWDTRFFLALCPPGQTARPDCRELTRGVWMMPAEALAAHAAGDLALAPPTFYILSEISRYEDARALQEFAVKRSIRPVLPQAFSQGGRWGILLPHDPDYEADTFPPTPISGEPSRIVLTDRGWSLEAR